MKVPVQNMQKIKVQTTMLRILYGGGILTAAVVAPNLLRFFPADRSKSRRQALYRRISDAQYRLVQRGLITHEQTPQGKRFRLTPAGTGVIEKILLKEYRVPEQIHWDGKWRMLIFDVKETRKTVREKLRRLLADTGFIRLQDSVWIYPYPCDEFVALVRAHLASGVGELRTFVVEALESDRALREHFKLD